MGNSRIKWRLQQPDGDSAPQSGSAASVVELIDSLESMPQPGLVRLASVRADASVAEFASWAESRWSLKPRIATVSSNCGGVRNAYSDVSRMGVDRWLAMLAAYGEIRSACLVIDGGTAFTLDLIDTDGQHLGGYILPGLSLMASALEENTAIRLQSVDTEISVQPGSITEAAVRNGSLASVIALIEKNLSQLQQRGGEVCVLIGGGDAPLLAKALAAEGMADVRIRPNLVLDGLPIACGEAGE
ncbi:MAG: type III pantothenate kinase [Gammaproteobacteria bacterium]